MTKRTTLLLAALALAATAGYRLALAANTSGGAQKFTADDYIAIEQLYAAYAHALDNGEAARFAATFVEDGEFTGGRAAGHGSEVRTPTKGSAALSAMGSRGGTRHFTANLLITPSPDGAQGSCYLLLFNARNVPATIVETAIYEDTLVKTAQGWKFKKRVVWRDDDDISPFKPKLLPTETK